MPEPNPYEAPREAPLTAQFSDSDSEVVELRRRVEQLEKRLGKNWLVSPSFVKRMFGVVGYFILGYFTIGIAVYAVVGIMMLIGYLLGVRF